MNEQNTKTGNTALHYAVMDNDKITGAKMAKILLKNDKVKTNIRNELNQTPMDIIASQIISEYWNIERVIYGLHFIKMKIIHNVLFCLIYLK